MLTAAQQAAIRDYSDRGYQRINRALRENDHTPALRKKIELLSSALEALPAFEGDVYRGVTIDDPTWLEQYRRRGQEIVEPAFVSTSRSPLKAFSGNVRFYILSRRGKAIGAWSHHPDEEEVLFVPGSRFKVLEFASSEDHTEIFLEEL